MLGTKQPIPSAEQDFLAEGGVMGELIRQFDWSKTSLGPIESWTGTFKNAIHLCLTSEFPSTIYCGPELLVMYNDAFIKLAGRKHPEGILGLKLSETRKEVWPYIAQFITTAYEKNRAVRVENLFLPLDLVGFLEEYYFTLAYIPMGAPGKVEAVYTNVYIMTEKVFQARQLETLKEIELRLSDVKTADKVCAQVIKTLSIYNKKDVPFSLLYMIDRKNNLAKLLSAAESIQSGSILSPSTLSLKESEEAKAIWPLAKMMTSEKPEVVDISQISSVPGGDWNEPAKKAILIPIRLAGQESPVAVFVAGVSAMRHLDEGYLRFFSSIGSLLVRGITNAEAHENEQKRLKSLVQIDRAKIAIFGTLSHELRTPLTLILGPLEQLLTDTQFSLTSTQLDLLQMMLRNTRRLLKLVNNVLDFSRIEAHRFQGEFEPINIAEYTNYLVTFFRPAIEKAGLAFNVDIKSIDEPLYVDRSMWEKMIFNILSDAFKYTLKGGITITLKKLDHHIELSISDTGIGIAEKDLPHIFERFYRVPGAVGRSAEGSGIGLSLAQELAKLHGGSIRVASELNKGTTFIIAIPLGKDHLPVNQIKSAEKITEPPELLASAYIDEVMSWLPEDAEKSLALLQPISLMPAKLEVKEIAEEKRETILVIDDNSDMRIYLHSLLAPYWDVIEVVSAEDAIEAAKKNKPDLIVCDLLMGKMSGLELTKKFRTESETRVTPIILVSASISEEARTKGLESGADDYLNKPFSAKELLARIRTQLELGKVRIELQKLIDELKNANESLTKSKESYRVLTSMSPVGILHLGQDGKAFYSNPKGFEILGLAPGTSAKELSQVWEDQLHPDDRERVVTLWNNTVKYRLDHYKSEYRFVHKDKSVVWVIGEAISEKDTLGNFLGYILTLTDVTRIKELLDRQVRVVDSLCHELRNPLSGIHGNIKLLLSYLLSLKTSIKKLDDKYKFMPEEKEALFRCLDDSSESADAMKKCAEHQKVVTDDVLDLSKLEAHKVSLNERVFDPYRVIQDALSMVSIDVKAKGLAIVLQHSILDFGVISDPDRLKQIILNLLTNAVRFTGPKGKITLGFEPAEVTEENCVLKFFIEDTGIGISEENRLKLFNRFAQAELRTFSEYGGSGLGLSISRQLVELMGGSIDVTSTLGKGSRFTFTIQCKRLVKQTMKSKRAPGEFKALPTKADVELCQGMVALIVEDNIINQKMLARLLGRYGIKSYVASDGKQAIDMVKDKKNEINVILMDIEMPVMNGLDATKEIRSIEKEKTMSPFHIIGISGNARPEYKQLAINSGMDAYFTKPYEIEHIVAEIKRKIKSMRSPASAKKKMSPSPVEKKSGSESFTFSEARQEGGGFNASSIIKISEGEKEKSIAKSAEEQHRQSLLTIEKSSASAHSVSTPTQELSKKVRESVSPFHH